MKVFGIEITDAQLDAAMAMMRDLGSKSAPGASGFTATNVEQALVRAGVPERIKTTFCSSDAVAHRAADRLIQKLRKQGRITFDRPYWFWVS